MAESFESVLDSPIHLDFGIPRHRWHDPFDEDGNLYHPTNPPKAVPPAYKEDFKSRI